ncbi:MAG: hypothetical protein BWY71_02023 [Planctomycetes bacterium ADurb.Bin412]|nr:MAG: hypothetical protein BWY71_02023 [Planctomycetes bacterium ADurb.Bin412]
MVRLHQEKAPSWRRSKLPWVITPLLRILNRLYRNQGAGESAMTLPGWKGRGWWRLSRLTMGKNWLRDWLRWLLAVTLSRPAICIRNPSSLNRRSNYGWRPITLPRYATTTRPCGGGFCESPSRWLSRLRSATLKLKKSSRTQRRQGRLFWLGQYAAVCSGKKGVWLFPIVSKPRRPAIGKIWTPCGTFSMTAASSRNRPLSP